MRQVEHIDLVIDMDAVLATLPARHKEAMVMYMQGYSQREVGKAFQVDHTTICKWLRQFRTKMHSWNAYE